MTEGKKKKIFISPQAMPDDYEDLGFVSAYYVLGTGLIFSFLSFFSDFFGGTSESFHSKIKNVESTAIARIITNASLMGADAVFNFHISISEAARNHGMLIGHVYGNAARKSD